jgi:hypothetical protein
LKPPSFLLPSYHGYRLQKFSSDKETHEYIAKFQSLLYKKTSMGPYRCILITILLRLDFTNWFLPTDIPQLVYAHSEQ